MTKETIRCQHFLPIDQCTHCWPIFQKETAPITDVALEISAIFDAWPIEERPPQGLWDSIYATWTGLWTDGYGQWDELEPSDVWPVSELLSIKRVEDINQQILDIIDSHEEKMLKNIAYHAGLPLKDVKQWAYSKGENEV